MNITNPLLSDWTAAHGLPPFDEIEPVHFAPAFDKALLDHRAEIDTIAGRTDAPTFANTIDALEDCGRLLTRVASVFFNLVHTDASDTLQEIERDMAPRLARHRADTLLNKMLFARIEALYSKRSALDLDAEQDRVLTLYREMFQRAGAQLDDTGAQRMQDIMQRLATLGTGFAQNVLKDESEYELALGAEDAAGLPDFVRDAAKSAAQARGAQGEYVITLSRSLIEPFLTFCDNRALRETAYKAWRARGETDPARNNLAIVEETVALRLERAKLLGFDNFAAFKLDDQMAKTPGNVRHLLEQVWAPARARALSEAEQLQDLIARDGGNFKLAPWDWRYYAEKLKRRDHAIDDTEIKPYLALDNVIAAAFDVAHRLFGLTFTELDEMPVHHGDVRVFEVTDRDGLHVGLFLGDYFARNGKRSGAWMSSFRDQEKLDENIRPIIINVMNFAKAPGGAPTLLTFDDARTLFHEFGHGLHGLLSDVTYPLISGTGVKRDFVELPSQLYEHWLMEPTVLAEHARHYKTGAPMPPDLIKKIKAAETFLAGFNTVEYAASALVDLAIHELEATADFDAATFERTTLERLDMPPSLDMRHRTPHFSHAFAGDGYSAGYYSYMWSEVMDADAFSAFEERGNVFDAGTAAKLYDHIYSAGGRQDPADAYKAFRGRAPEIDALLEKRGLADAPGWRTRLPDAHVGPGAPSQGEADE